MSKLKHTLLVGEEALSGGEQVLAGDQGAAAQLVVHSVWVRVSEQPPGRRQVSPLAWAGELQLVQHQRPPGVLLIEMCQIIIIIVNSLKDRYGQK